MSEVLDLTGDGGVTKTVIRSAKPGAVGPSESALIVDVHYEGRLADTGEIFDSTRDDNTVFTFELGKGNVIRAWDIAIKTMLVGEIAKVTCSPDYAYGKMGSPPDIPPDATLIFEVELVTAKPPKGATLDEVEAEKAKLGEIRKEREAAAAKKEEDKKKREEAKHAAATRLQAKLEAKRTGAKGGAKSGGKKVK